MNSFKPKVRPAERDALCRACDGDITKGQNMVSWYSHRNRGMYIHLCGSCAIQIGKIFVEDIQQELKISMIEQNIRSCSPCDCPDCANSYCDSCGGTGLRYFARSSEEPPCDVCHGSGKINN